MKRSLFAHVTLAFAVIACGGRAVSIAPADAKTACQAAMKGSSPAACDLIGTRVTGDRHMTLAGTLAEVPPSGKAALVDFWSVSCAPCVEAMPALQAAASAGVPVFGVSTDDNPGLVMNTAKARGVSYPIFLDDRGLLRGAFRVGGDLPRLFVVDATGSVRGVFGGATGSVDRAVALYRALAR